ncbi:phage major capsid protein [Methylobacterium organophilum]|uniref:phage major capsid protein n=1 Tax=Methylobacterium TaxID=407 RepID=UPI0019CF655D|nr:phage major capsid protein [Methylobacterium organophilum]MBN6819529.1 phage major capsid protein [Methylobacterium organophilum]
MNNVTPVAAAKAAPTHLLALGNRPRGILSPSIRADASDPKKILADLTKAFEDFKAQNEENIKKGADVVASEKAERINAAVGDLQKKVDEYAVNAQKALDEVNAKLAAAQIGTGGPIGDLPPTSPEKMAAYKAWMRTGNVSAAMDKGTDGNGGYLAPIEWDRTIGMKLKQISPIRANARVQAISVAGFKKLFSDRAVGSGWVGETASRPATTTPQIGSLDFTPGELYANPAISQQLLDDAAVNLETWLAEEVDTEFARQEGIAFLSGNGTNKPYGILTYVTGGANAARHPYGAIATVNSGAANGLTGDGMIDMMYSLPSQFAINAKLYMNRLSLGAARKLKDGQGNYLWQPSYQQGEPQTLGGAPIVEVPDMPVVAAGNIAALYGDMAATYLVIDRIGISVLRDPFTDKPYVHFYTVRRVGGGVYNPEPMRALVVAANS